MTFSSIADLRGVFARACSAAHFWDVCLELSSMSWEGVEVQHYVEQHIESWGYVYQPTFPVLWCDRASFGVFDGMREKVLADGGEGYEPWIDLPSFSMGVSSEVFSIDEGRSIEQLEGFLVDWVEKQRPASEQIFMWRLACARWVYELDRDGVGAITGICSFPETLFYELQRRAQAPTFRVQPHRSHPGRAGPAGARQDHRISGCFLHVSELDFVNFVSGLIGPAGLILTKAPYHRPGCCYAERCSRMPFASPRVEARRTRKK